MNFNHAGDDFKSFGHVIGIALRDNFRTATVLGYSNPACLPEMTSCTPGKLWAFNEDNNEVPSAPPHYLRRHNSKP